MSGYEIGILGDVPDVSRAALETTLREFIEDFELEVGRDVMIRLGSQFDIRNPHAATVVAYFGGATQADQPLARQAFDASLPVIPVVPSTGEFQTLIPEFLQEANGLKIRNDDPELRSLSVALLECVGLLRRQRRVFVSYRREESRNAAVQLHDLLSGRGFDVFLDTHDIRPGEPFQEVLWHRLCDSDVLVMLDTPTYFESKWTRQELGRARAKEIHVLRVVWPDHIPTKHTDLAETIYLDPGDLCDEKGPLADEPADRIVLAVESVRSRSIASRNLSITGKLRAEVEKIGGTVEGVGAHRAVSLKLPTDERLWAYPIVGIPTAELLNDIANKARQADQIGSPILVYDHIGIREQWMDHLKWLDENIKSIQAISVSEAAWILAAWEQRA